MQSCLKFRFELDQLPPVLLVLLGEIASRCDCLGLLPLDPVAAQSIHRLYLAKGIHATAALEGNTLTEKEVLMHLEGNLLLPPSREHLGQQVGNVLSAYSWIINRLSAGNDSLLPGQVCELNRMVLRNLVLEAGVVPGEIRQKTIQVEPGASAEDCEYLLDRLCVWLSGPAFHAPQGMQLVYAIIRAVVAHAYLAWIQPFGQGNGITARLVELQLLLADGMPAAAAQVLPAHYHGTRTEYQRELNQACKGEGDIGPFLVYAVQGFLDGLREQYGFICSRQKSIAWRDYVYELFRGKEKVSDRRQRHLALDLGAQEVPVSVSEIATLTPALALAYANRSAKTLQRDLAVLEQLSLVERSSRGVRARIEIVMGFQSLNA